MRQWVRDHALGLVFIVLWLLFWAGQTWTNWVEYGQEQEAHRQAVTLAGFLAFWGGRTLENLQSEMFQLASFVIFSAYLIYRGSAESKEGQNRIEAKVDWLLQKANKNPADFQDVT
jgi:hypothetical protein